MWLRIDPDRITVHTTKRSFNRVPATQRVNLNDWLRITREAAVVDRQMARLRHTATNR